MKQSSIVLAAVFDFCRTVLLSDRSGLGGYPTGRVSRQKATRRHGVRRGSAWSVCRGGALAGQAGKGIGAGFQPAWRWGRRRGRCHSHPRHCPPHPRHWPPRPRHWPPRLRHWPPRLRHWPPHPHRWPPHPHRWPPHPHRWPPHPHRWPPHLRRWPPRPRQRQPRPRQRQPRPRQRQPRPQRWSKGSAASPSCPLPTFPNVRKTPK